MALFKHLVVLGLCFSAGAFRIYEAENLESHGFPESCVSALSADITCDPYIRSFMQPRYRGSLRNVTLTDQICVGTCSGSLRKWVDTVSKECAGESFGSANNAPTRYGGNIWAGWNETCIKDPRTKKYCNDIIDEFSSPGDDESRPREELCHICYQRRFAVMQSSQYSIYNEYYKNKLEYIYKTCGRSGPTEILPPLKPKQKELDFCLSGNYYTSKEGDTCDSISKEAGVSGALLYMGNQDDIANCREVPAGLKLCLPTACETYYVKKGDTCFTVESALGLRIDSIPKYNSWVNRDCTNLQGGTDFYGKTICVSPLGSKATIEGVLKASIVKHKSSSANGPVVLRTDPPKEAKVAEGTTLMCGDWHVVTKSDTCTSICKENDICEDDLMLAINPSLTEKKCDESLVPGTALCVAPVSGWDSTKKEL
ncbi:uncharacterized protein FIESC28_01058 [Fusarium coffeatum]|uniref:LysM domain-containing protein n=1 Tax=Fusarium coffeatum TaxID=231269 RepID=A0A366SA15_9HYPO|nr:uncharacterized protein FIESC28_01058 [Fusarium coffeatum]RBR26167.1 hypothetical protein FIESC28_01058 [Fusarium coffeatum]